MTYAVKRTAPKMVTILAQATPSHRYIDLLLSLAGGLDESDNSAAAHQRDTPAIKKRRAVPATILGNPGRTLFRTGMFSPQPRNRTDAPTKETSPPANLAISLGHCEISAMVII